MYFPKFKPVNMKLFYLLFACYLLSSCGNKKAEIVEEIKKTKNELGVAQLNRGLYNRAANKLLILKMSSDASKKYRDNRQIQLQAEADKEAYEMAVKDLKEAPPEALNDRKKLD